MQIVKNFDTIYVPRVFQNDKRVLSLFLKRFTFRIVNTTLPKEYFDQEKLSKVIFYPIVPALKKSSG